MWEGFKVKQIVLANTGMENAPTPPVETIPKLAASVAGSVSVVPPSLSPSKANSNNVLGLLSLQSKALEP